MDEYISKAEAIEAIRQTYCPNCNSYNGSMCRACGYKDCMDIVDDVKAADVKPVKHGKWIDIHEWCKMHNSKPSGIGFYYWCSNCGKCVNHRTNYCGECGARMDGDAG